MKGLITKELIMLKKQGRSFAFIAVIFSAVSIFNDISFAFLLPVIMSIIPINMMALDEQSKWQQYAITLPYGRKNIVTSKYIFYVINTLISMAVLTIVYIISSVVKPETEISLTFMLIGGLVAGNVYPLIMLPLTFRFNSATGRTILIVASMTFGGIVGGLTSALAFQEIDGETNINETLINIFNSPFLPVVIIAVIAVLYLISWAISVKIYEKRDL